MSEVVDQEKKPYISSFVCALCSVLLLVFFYWSKPPFTLAFDPNDEKCLPDMHLALLMHSKPDSVHDGDYLFFKPNEALSYVKQEFVLKMVGGIPGDHLVIHDGVVSINGVVMSKSMPLASFYHKNTQGFDRDETVPEGKFFMVGTNINSDDSRYWGYLDVKDVAGHAYKVF